MPKNKGKHKYWVKNRAHKQIVVSEEESWFTLDNKLNVRLNEYSNGNWMVGVFDYDDGCMEIILQDERKARWIFDRIVHLVTRDEVRNLGLV